MLLFMVFFPRDLSGNVVELDTGLGVILSRSLEAGSGEVDRLCELLSCKALPLRDPLGFLRLDDALDAPASLFWALEAGFSMLGSLERVEPLVFKALSLGDSFGDILGLDDGLDVLFSLSSSLESVKGGLEDGVIAMSFVMGPLGDILGLDGLGVFVSWS